jgi:hypothetical protein
VFLKIYVFWFTSRRRISEDLNLQMIVYLQVLLLVTLDSSALNKHDYKDVRTQETFKHAQNPHL